MPQGKEREGSVPPIIKKISGGDPMKEAALIMARNLLRDIIAANFLGEDSQRVREQFDGLLKENPWLEQVESPLFKSPLMRIRKDINHSLPLPLGV